MVEAFDFAVRLWMSRRGPIMVNTVPLDYGLEFS